MTLRIVLMGTGDFAVPPFQAVLESEHTVVAVLTQADKSGAGHHKHVNVVRSLAESFKVPVLQPEKVNRPEVLDVLRGFNADVFLVAAYGQILKPALLAIPRLGAFNLHGSLLPRHRGAAPVQYSILKGDAKAGVTIFQIEPQLDSGPMLGTVETPIEANETSADLMKRLAQLSVGLTLESLRQLASGAAVLTRQDESMVTLAPKLSREDGLIDWNQPASSIQCQIRAMQPWPKASSVLVRPGHDNVRCLFFSSTVSDRTAELERSTPGEIRVADGQLHVRCQDQWLVIRMIQVEGRKAVDGRSFINGNPLPTGSRFQPGMVS